MHTQTLVTKIKDCIKQYRLTTSSIFFLNYLSSSVKYIVYANWDAAYALKKQLPGALG